jgi:N-acetylneuraminate synthase
MQKNLPFIIAEIGINHNGDIDLTKKLIKVASDAGCHAVKFQKRNPDVCVPEHQKSVLRETPWGIITYLDYKYKVEFEKDEYDIIDQYCKELKIEWFASAWDLDSQDFLNQYDCNYNKIASAMLTNKDLLTVVAKEKKYTFISTGMSTMEEIRSAVQIFEKMECPFELMHCCSEYPTMPKDVNLKAMATLKNEFKCNVGYSGHEKGLQITLAAVAMGCSSVERHVTLDRTMFGTDQSASVEPKGLKILVRDIKIVCDAMGDGIKKVTDTEKNMAKKMRTV